MTTLFARCCVILLLAGGTVGCDVLTKRMAAEKLAGVQARSVLADTIRLTYAENAGGFLSFGATLPEWARTRVFMVVVGFVLLLLATVAWRNGWQRWRAAAFALFIVPARSTESPLRANRRRAGNCSLSAETGAGVFLQAR